MPAQDPQQVEAAARARGCSLVYLETFTLQAPRLDLRLGFESACRLEGFPDDMVSTSQRRGPEKRAAWSGGMASPSRSAKAGHRDRTRMSACHKKLWQRLRIKP